MFQLTIFADQRRLTIGDDLVDTAHRINQTLRHGKPKRF